VHEISAKPLARRRGRAYLSAMEYRPLGTSQIKVSQICLGTMTWGKQNSQDDAFEQMDYALTRGINFFDTAEMYAVPPDASTYGKTEEMIGNWFAARPGAREKIILASKIAGPNPYFSYVRGGVSKHNRENIRAALDDSLRRLQTDYIDLYQLHWPERVVNSFGKLDYVHTPAQDGTPLLETLEALNEEVKAGRIREVGLSNETPWGVMECLRLSEKHNLPRMQSVQNCYNLVSRRDEIGLTEVLIRANCGMLAYSPLGGGTLSGKYLDGQMPAGSRRSVDARPWNRYTHPRTDAATRAYIALAKKFGLDPCQMAIAFVNAQPFVTSNIIGATTMAQLKTDIDALNVKLTPEIFTAINAIHLDNPNPAP
jgi:aryl-alcohol dehydrogenase-like predicted oxidoreductase